MYIKTSCNIVNVAGDSVRSTITFHGLRVTAITNLFEPGYYMERIILKYGHRKPRSINHTRILVELLVGV